MEALELPADVFTCNERFMRGVAVGPFYSVPGLWTSLQLPFDLLGSGERVVAFTGDTVSPSGEVIAYPPLHMHHIHVAKQDPRGDANVHWFETHGDYHMDPRRGYRRELPTGYCDVVDGHKKVTIEVQVNDVRYGSDIAMSAEAARPTVHGPGAHPSAPPISWYLRILFELAEHPCHSASKVLLFHPLDATVYTDMLGRYSLPAAPSLRWWTTRWPRTGVLLPPGWAHIHRARYTGLLVVAGHHSPWTLGGSAASQMASELGSRGHRSQEHAVREECAQLPHPLPLSCSALAEMRSLLLAAASKRDVLICHDDPDEANFVKIGAQDPGGSGGHAGVHDRPGGLVCRANTFRANDALTIFSFSEARWNHNMPTFTQHTLLFFYYNRLGTPSEPSLVDDVFPYEMGAWSLKGWERHLVCTDKGIDKGTGGGPIDQQGQCTVFEMHHRGMPNSSQPALGGGDYISDPEWRAVHTSKGFTSLADVGLKLRV